jgi:serine phosphatase RsbU (regulator of sigma subunit)
MANFLQSILDPPAFHSLPFKEMQKRRLFNRGNMAGSVFCLFFTVVGFATGQHKLAYLTGFDMLALLSGVALNLSGRLDIARHVSFNASTLLFVGCNYFYGSIVHTEIYLFVFPAIVVFMFDDKKVIIAYCVYLLALFMLCLYLQKHFDGKYEGDVSQLAAFSYMNYVFGFSMLAAIIYSFKSESLENNEKIEAQKQAIEEKSSEITASITYAKRIQDSLLTPVSVFEKNIGSYFLFYNPKDIVSGDFYWAHSLSSTEIIFAVGDCTGHGVPGALVSSVCIGKLNEAVGKNISPGKILEQVNREIKINLNQEGNENVRDGMDIVLCHLNMSQKKLKYAGANRPLWIIKKDPSKEPLLEMKADKVAIGGFTEHSQQFSEKEIILEDGDTIYLFTDGYADQFGGEQGKKLTTKRFRELIMGSNHLPVKEIGKELSKAYQSWKGKHEQIDDVTVLAIRV